MDVLWSPWRYDYIKARKDKASTEASDCVFCGVINSSVEDEEVFILHRAEFNFVILNIYPYISGHLMVVPYEHLPDLSIASKEITDEVMDLTKECKIALQKAYRPHGVNLGMNLGAAAGAGVAEHFHMHVLPRWVGDINFMTAISETQTIPESLKASFERLKPMF